MNWLLLIFSAAAFAQTTVPPQVISKKDPKFTDSARVNHAQGIVVIDMTVGVDGVPHSISVVSPLGFGLDEAAVEAVKKWRFKPATKGGVPVELGGYVEVRYQLDPNTFDQKGEERRSAYNSAMANLRRDDPKRKEKAVEAIQKLSRQNYAPAVFTEGAWKLDGKHVPVDRTAGLKQIEQAASKNYGQAMGLLGLFLFDGRFVEKDRERGMQLMADAAILGSAIAQSNLGRIYSEGAGVSKDVERAKRMFRLCAAQGDPSCQFHLAQLLLDGQTGEEKKKVEAIAWLRIAASNKHAEAEQLLATQEPSLSAEQNKKAASLQKQLMSAR